MIKSVMPGALRVFCWFAVMVFCFFGGLLSVIAEEEESASKEEPIDITSDRMDGDRSSREVVFTGNVVVKQGEMVMTCDWLKANYNEETRDITDLYSKGSVRIVEGDRTALGEEAYFFRQEGKVLLKGDPEVWQGKNLLQGEEITFFLEDDRVIVDKAKVRFYPEDKESLSLERKGMCPRSLSQNP